MARRNLHVRLTKDSYDAWQNFAARYGVSLSAVLEATGERLAEVVEGEPLSPLGEIVVRRAREIDQRHRSRRPRADEG